MSGRILFGERLQARLGPILEQAGFKLVEVQKDLFEVLIFERKVVGSIEPDRISFHGLEYGGHLYVSAYSGVKPVSLRTLKELLPDYALLDVEHSDKWTYSNINELEQCLDEIAQLTSDSLFAWFEEPEDNPAGLDMEPVVKLTKEQLQHKLKERIRIYGMAADRARAKGENEEAERHERSVREAKEMLSKS